MINSFAAAGGEQLLFTIFVMFVAAKLAAEIFERRHGAGLAHSSASIAVQGPPL